MTYKTLIIDDEPYARLELRHQLEPFNFIKILAECSNAVEGVKAVNKHKPDLIFLDIQMPGVTGFDMLSMIEDSLVPQVVFVTAYDDFAVKAFEENALDYLLKPIDPVRFSQTIDRIHVNMGHEARPRYQIKPLKKVPCCLNNVVKLIDLNDIDYIVSNATGVHVVNNEKTFLTDLSLKALEERTPLFRCHRQYLLNLDRIREIRLLKNGAAEAVTAREVLVPVSRRSLKSLKQYVGIR